MAGRGGLDAILLRFVTVFHLFVLASSLLLTGFTWYYIAYIENITYQPLFLCDVNELRSFTIHCLNLKWFPWVLSLWRPKNFQSIKIMTK